MTLLRNLGPKSAAWLADVGIRTRAELCEQGAIGACRQRHLAAVNGEALGCP